MNLLEKYKELSDHDRSVYERLHAAFADLADWKATVLSCSALHRINYMHVARTGRAPRSHAEGNRWVEAELPRARRAYKRLYALSRRARYCDGSRINDGDRQRAVDLLDRLEKELPFPE